ncbi:MAG TPA: glycosyltransferase [Candidatus Saccharimonadales bacterium]|jgi:dolichol-phosphate mannosyltransferase|nr:glycosyltransferase [Candidatus Saccharimonadales bacterium]
MSITPQLVSVVVPVFNEEAGIPLLKDKLLRLQDLLAGEFEMELVFVDDGSRDRTVERLREEFGGAPVAFTIAEHGKNLGIGAAFRTGFENCRGQVICTIDADCSYSPEGLHLLLVALRTADADIAVASPYHPCGGVEGVAAWRLLLSRSCSQLYRWFSPLKLYTYTSIFRAYRAKVVQTVAFRSDGFVSAAEILIAAGRRGYKVAEVPMVLRARTAGQSKMKIMRTIASHLAMLWGFIAPAQAVAPERLAPRTSAALDDRN